MYISHEEYQKILSARKEKEIASLKQQLRETESKRDEVGRRYVAQVQECTELHRQLAQRKGWQKCEKHGEINADHAWGCPDCVDELRKEVAHLRECLRRVQFAPCEDSCEEHEPTDEDDEHNRSCVGCGHYQCMGCAPDCWLHQEIKEGE